MTGLGTIFHHTATAWFVCAVVAGIMSPSADPIGVLAVSLPLVLQHWIVQFKYVNFYAYVGLLLASEIWWEIEVAVHVHQFRWWHEQRCLWGMLVAHWLYWLGAIASFASALMAHNDDGGGDADGTAKPFVHANPKKLSKWGGTMDHMGAVMAARQAARATSTSSTSLRAGRPAHKGSLV